MILKTKDFQDIANKILLAISVDKSAANLELKTNGRELYLSITNKEFYVSIKLPIEEDEDFHATVDASLFLQLIAGLTSETFKLSVNANAVAISSGKSNYKIAMIYENDKMLELAPITIVNKTLEMPIKHEILASILNVNSKEIQKVKGLKNANIREIQELYYIDESGCFTFTTGACLNSFELEKPVKLLLNERIVSLFKLFDGDVDFTLGQDALGNGMVRTKMTLVADNIYLAAIITCDDLLISQVQGPCAATKRFIKEAYPHKLVLSVTALRNAIKRLMLFTKNSVDKANMAFIPMIVRFDMDELSITDQQGNTEVVDVENGSYVDESYEMPINVVDLKLVLDSCKEDHITMNCGNGHSVVITRGNICNLIPEVHEKEKNAK